jgi:hypothetical protein
MITIEIKTSATSTTGTNTCNIKLNEILHEEVEEKMDILNLYKKKQMSMGNSEFESILMFLNDPDVPQQYKDQYYKLYKRNVVPMEVDMEMDDLGPPPPAPRLTRQNAHNIN